MLTYHVYLWVADSSVEPELVEVVQAASPELALLVAMERHELEQAAFVWVVSPDDETIDARAEGVVVCTDLDVLSEWFGSLTMEILHVE
jgi:hypothetical protein